MSDSTESGTPRTSAPSKPFHLNLPLQAVALLAWCGGWMAVQTLLMRSGADPRHQVLAFLGIAAALVAGLFLMARKWTYQLFTSVPFAITQMLFMAVAVMIGTLVLQELKPAEYRDLYGSRWWGGIPLFLLRHAHAADLYHSLWFYGLLLLISVSTLTVAWKKRPYPLHRMGFLLVHIAPTLVLLGGLWGRFSAVRAFNELRLGAPVGTFWRVKGPDPGEWKDAYQLPGFSVRLDRFRVDHYEPEYKLYAFVEPDGKGGFERNPKAYEVKEGMQGRLPLTWIRYKVDQVLPNAVDMGQWMENPAAEPNPALRLMLDLGDGQPMLGYLLAASPRAYRFSEPGGRFALLYREKFDAAEAAALKPHGPSKEKLALTFMGKSFEHDAKPGASWDFPVFSLKVAKLHPDFPFKEGPNGPIDVKTLPPALRGPWLELKLKAADGQEAPVFLCARTPAFSDEANAKTLPPGMTLHYVREGEEGLSRFVLFTADDQKARLVENGRITRTEPLVPGKAFAIAQGLSVTPVALLPHADWVPEFKANPDPKQAATFENPVLKLTLTDPDSGKSETHWLEAKGAGDAPPTGTTFFNGKVGLVYKEKDTEPKDFRSVIVVQDDAGRELARKEISVNDPLVFRGHWFYQSNYDPNDATVSGIMVVHEPGLLVTYLGFACLLLGTLWMFYLKPTLKKRAVEGKGA
jgi:hypothetical protein